MKKYILLAMLVFMAGTFFASCGGDDDNNDDITNNGGGGSDDEDFNTTSLIVGSWKTTYNIPVNGATVLGYDIQTFNSDGTGSIFYNEAGETGTIPIRYVYDSDKQMLTLTYIESGSTEIYRVKSISSTKLVLVILADEHGEYPNAEEEVYYRI